ncbi:hypothetical protein M5K25_005625 [Dendrobium thyrsiflorum]|uniref:Uncharacterized protein n=1 Tax=Dendrobium thyrsiflorum TaxID=117978 RepID=A0ABD0VJ00_DENTH
MMEEMGMVEVVIYSDMKEVEMEMAEEEMVMVAVVICSGKEEVVREMEVAEMVFGATISVYKYAIVCDKVLSHEAIRNQF